MHELETLLSSNALPNFQLRSEDFSKDLFDLEIFHQYVQTLREFCPWLLNEKHKEAVTTGIITYLGTVLYSRVKGVGSALKDRCLLHFVLIYINFDYLLDEGCVESKKLLLHHTSKYFKGELQEEEINLPSEVEKCLRLCTISCDYISRGSACGKSLLEKCFTETMLAAKLQENCDSRDSLHHITTTKAKVCLEVITSILEIDEPYLNQISFLAQVCDDLNDVVEDTLDGIHTLATHDISMVGDVDALITECVGIIKHMNVWYLRFLFVYLLIIFGSCSPYVSETKRNLFKQYYPFRWDGVEYTPNKFIRNFLWDILSKIW